MSKPWIDISVPIRNGMAHWPGDPPVTVERTSDVGRGDSFTLSRICMGSHTGTHVDAPLHFLEGGRGIDEMPVEAAVGTARVIEFDSATIITVDDLVPHRIRQGERILLKTNNSVEAWKSGEFVEDFVALSLEAAGWLAAHKVRCVGIDYLSIAPFHEGTEVHQTLLAAGVWIIEGLDLSRVGAGRYEMICLPLRLEGGDGAPARAFLRRI